MPAKVPLSAKTHFLRGAIALAATGVPIFNALNHRGADAFLAGELDEFGGQAGRADDYHYCAGRRKPRDTALRAMARGSFDS